MIVEKVQQDFYTQLVEIIPEDVTAEEFGKIIGELIQQEYGSHNLSLFLKGLSEELDL
jgi:hypothetical protein